jgi:hypothetical protein
MSPQAELAMYLKRDTGIDLDPEVIRKFIAGRFVTISILAHEIYEPHIPPGHPSGRLMP